MERILKTSLTAVLLLLVATPASSVAGRYHVYSCRMPDGEVAPTDGWSGTVASGGAFDDYATDSCESGGALVAALGDQTAHLTSVDQATWSFETPSFDRMVAASLFRAGDTDGGGNGNATYQFWLSAPKLTSVFSQCVAAAGCKSAGEIGKPLNEVNQIVVPEAHLGAKILLSAGCGGAREPEPFECPTGQGDPNNYAAALYLYAADLTLEQTAGPTVSAVGGELASSPSVSGTSDLTFTASDPGAGVYEAVFSVDGKAVQATVLDEAGGHCRNVGQTSDGLPAFLYLQPCPSTVSADVGFDSSSLAPGAHHLIVSVIDAAGNSAPVLDRTIDVPAPSPAPPGSTSALLPGAAGGAPLPGTPNGLGASSSAVLTARWQSTANSRLTTPFGRTETITGRLTNPGGVPIAGAQISVTSTVPLAGAAVSAMKAAQTNAGGAFTVRLPARLSSRAIVLSYTAHAGDPVPTAQRALQLAVEAPVSLSIAPRTAPSQGTIRFRGRLLSGPLPKGGKPVILEARSGRGRWLEFHVVKTGSRGRFSSSYHFKFPGPAHYQFRAVCEQEADYPFAAGSSRAVSVTER
jgi:hypothetical protein